jgi:4-hydroxy-tetrahydrodipicolinate reductase
MLQEFGTQVPVLRAANFARGVQALLRTVGEAVGALPGYDVELTETHHNGKRDAPSGTAKTILEEIREYREFETVPGREGIQPRTDEEVGMLVRRAGDVRGEHEITIAGNDEVLTLSHRAEDRAVFAAGALDAAAWLAGREPGRYEFGDVIDAGQ